MCLPGAGMSPIILALLMLTTAQSAPTVEECLELYDFRLGCYSDRDVQHKYRRLSLATHPNRTRMDTESQFRRVAECKDILLAMREPQNFYACEPNCGLCQRQYFRFLECESCQEGPGSGRKHTCGLERLAHASRFYTQKLQTLMELKTYKINLAHTRNPKTAQDKVQQLRREEAADQKAEQKRRQEEKEKKLLEEAAQRRKKAKLEEAREQFHRLLAQQDRLLAQQDAVQSCGASEEEEELGVQHNYVRN